MDNHTHNGNCCGRTLAEELDTIANVHPAGYKPIESLFVDTQAIGRALRDLQPLTPQDRFNATYITGPEICRLLGVSRAALAQVRAAGNLPDAIELGKGLPLLWERRSVEPYLESWAAALKHRRTKGGVNEQG